MGGSKSSKKNSGKRTSRDEDADNNEKGRGTSSEDEFQRAYKQPRLSDSFPLSVNKIFENAGSPSRTPSEVTDTRNTSGSPRTPGYSINHLDGHSGHTPPSTQSNIPIGSPGENGQQLVVDAEAGQLSKHRPRHGQIYEAICFREESIRERLKALASSTEHPTIEMGLEMADGAYLLQIMNISNPTDEIEKAWQKAYTGATLLLQGRRLLEDCRDILKSVFQPQ